MLDKRRDDKGFVDGIVLAARPAWDDIGTTVVGRSGWAQRPADDYEVGRDDRLQQMLDEDFAALLGRAPVGVHRAGPDEPDAADAGDDGSDPADPTRRASDLSGCQTAEPPTRSRVLSPSGSIVLGARGRMR